MATRKIPHQEDDKKNSESAHKGSASNSDQFGRSLEKESANKKRIEATRVKQVNPKRRLKKLQHDPLEGIVERKSLYIDIVVAIVTGFITGIGSIACMENKWIFILICHYLAEVMKWIMSMLIALL